MPTIDAVILLPADQRISGVSPVQPGANRSPKI
jgi:hypothetical protein